MKLDVAMLLAAGGGRKPLTGETVAIMIVVGLVIFFGIVFLGFSARRRKNK